MEKNNQHIRFVIGLGSCGIAAGAKDLYGELASKIENNPDVSLSHTSCNGMCFKEPILEVFYPDGNHLMMGNVHKKDLDKILDPSLIRAQLMKNSSSKIQVSQTEEKIFGRNSIRLF
nr:(2Fe-2S) ferredoxin domain-containing protein [Candidatus Kuenenia stuttgartiensis]